ALRAGPFGRDLHGRGGRRVRALQLRRRAVHDRRVRIDLRALGRDGRVRAAAGGRVRVTGAPPVRAVGARPVHLRLSHVGREQPRARGRGRGRPPPRGAPGLAGAAAGDGARPPPRARGRRVHDLRLRPRALSRLPRALATPGMPALFGDPAALLGAVVLKLPALLVAVTVHEVAHGLVADRLGDPTARLRGRLTLIPLPPLAGGHFLPYVLPRRAGPLLRELERYGPLLLVVILLSGAAGFVLDPVIRWVSGIYVAVVKILV